VSGPEARAGVGRFGPGSLLSPKEIRAMDRRRFVPSPDGLELRTLMATTSSPFNLFGTASNAAQTLPITFQQKELRIQKMPDNLRALEPNRFLPPDTIHQIQLGLNEIMSSMTLPPKKALTNYNLLMRKIVFHPSVSAGSAQKLDHAFKAVLVSGHAPEPGLTTLVSSVNVLVSQVDTASIGPTNLATNDNAYILQLAIVIGQQMPAPRAPTIAKTSGHQVNPRVAITPLSNPTYVGNYEYNTTIQMLNVANNEVIGTAVVAKNGRYALTISTPLAVGKYKLAVRAVDEVGHIGHASRVFGLQVVPPRHHPA
jgi:hypothetical protein